MQIKKSKYLFFYHRNFPDISINNLINEDLALTNQIVAIPILYGKEVIISKEEFEYVNNIKETEWIYVEDFQHPNLLKYGLVLCDLPEFELFVKREEQLVNDKWHIYAALYNFMTKWKDIDVNFVEKNVMLNPKEEMEVFIDLNGVPPTHFFKVENPKEIKKISYDDYSNDDFFKVLLNRKTARNFDTNKQLSFKDFSNILKYTFGVHGYCNTYGDKIKSVKKTSPSGGGLHPTEVYMLVLRVENLKHGLYHYNIEDESLYMIKEYTLEEAMEKSRFFSAGQEYTSFSSVMFFLATRYYRNYWKYRKNSAAYGVTIRDAAHLCQTLYLICSKLGLGSFTAAINHSNIEEEIGLDPYKQGVVMMAGCGIMNPTPKIDLEPKFDSYLD